MAEEKTKITKVSDSELADILNMGGADNVMSDEDKNKSPFKRPNNEVNLSLNNDSEEEEEEEEEEQEEEEIEDDENKSKNKNPEFEINLNEQEEEEEEEQQEEEDDENKNPKIKKNYSLAALEELAKNNVILLFEGDKPLKDYTRKEQIELIEANLNRVKEEAEAKAPAEFFDSMPESFKYVAKYHADGGKDLKSIYKYLAQAEEFNALDITTEKGQEETVRTYLKLNGDMTAEEIEEEVNGIKDLPGALEKKAKLYKPKLDAKQQQIIDKQVADQEALRIKREQATIKYRETVLNALSADDLDGLKIEKNTKAMLYNGLTQFNYPSVNGNNTNLLGHLLEQHNYVKPNPALMAKTLWLLKDPKGFEDSIKAAGGKEVVIDAVKKLKSASDGKTTNVNTNQQVTQNKNPKKTIAKPVNIFARP